MTLFREQIANRLLEDLVGPIATDEVLRDRPSDRYMTGILHPQETEMAAEDDDELVGGDDGDAEADIVPDGVPLISTLKPSSAGLSFCVDSDSNPRLHLVVSCGSYSRFHVDDEEVETQEVRTREFQRWRRRDFVVQLDNLELPERSTINLDLSEHGPKGLHLHIQVGVAPGGRKTVTAALVNTNTRGETRAESEERSFFQTKLEARPGTDTRFVPRPSMRTTVDEDDRVSALIYRAAREFAVGHSCAAAWEIKDDAVPLVATTWIPSAIVPAMNADGDPAFDPIREESSAEPLSAEWLSRTETTVLVTALHEFVACYRSWIADQRARVDGLGSLSAQAKAHLDVCDEAAARMMSGIALVERDASVATAFKLSQRAMALQYQWARNSALAWRPFQLGFQLLCLESLAERSHPDRSVMDLLWFPTGGGKTEAYLAAAALVFFLRRLRSSATDDGGGVAVIMRYTLRLLTIQQFERAAGMICACEHIRRLAKTKGSVDLGHRSFSIGLWVGNNATPATLRLAAKPPPGSPASHRQLTECPACRSPVRWSLLRSEPRAQCTNENGDCEFAAVDPALPVWTIDEDIYNEAPSLVIGTVDKFAQIVRKTETGFLFARDTDHSPPDLIIQDELHLISGPLGTMTGLYETAIDLLCAHKGSFPKILGSTATIRRANQQIAALFCRDAFQFPPPGLDASNSCFAVEDRNAPGRLYLGLSTAGRSAKFAVQAISAALLQSAAMVGPTDGERDPYWTFVGYFNTLRELGGSLVLMQDDVPISMHQYAARRGETPRNPGAPAELTSRVSSKDIRAMLDELKVSYPNNDATGIVLASNMISVGMDIPRLGLMMVVGQPKTFAEYIQATSRVGRGTTPGLVVTLYNAGRVRDRAHFESFATWHQTLYREVEATSVTPFASRAVDKALHAVLVALVRHLIPELRNSPALTPGTQAKVLALASRIEDRVKKVDADELKGVSEKLVRLAAEWANAGALKVYWDDYGKKSSLLMSAEQHAAQQQAQQVQARGLWPTPNSMREVEPGSPFVLVPALRAKENDATE